MADHSDEEDSAFVLAPKPADPPITDGIAERLQLAKPKELGLNRHGNSRPNRFVARLGTTGNAPSASRPRG